MRIVNGPGGAGSGGPDTLLVSLQAVKNRAATIEMRTEKTMFPLGG